MKFLVLLLILIGLALAIHLRAGGREARREVSRAECCEQGERAGERPNRERL